jgi:hypothetical protein
LSHFKNLEDFKEEWHKIKNGIIKDIEETKSFQELVNQKEGYQSPYKVERGNPYNHAFKGVRCISIDLKSANFNSLRFFNPETVLNTKDFSELVSRYSSVPYYSHVKIFRQVVFEKLQPNKQQGLQRKMMDSVLTELFKIKPDLYVRMPSNDEIIIPLNNGQEKFTTQFQEAIKNHPLTEILRLEEFSVEHIFDDLFYKKFDDGKIVLRNVPSPYYSKAYKMVRGLEITDEDSYFIYEGKLAKFVKE